MRVSPFAVGNKPSKITTDIPLNTVQVLEDQKELPSGHGLIRILHQDYGDKRLMWDTKDFTQVREAQEIFKKLIGDGFVPYLIGRDGEPTSMPMAEFDPTVGEVFMEEREIIMVPMQHAVGG